MNKIEYELPSLHKNNEMCMNLFLGLTYINILFKDSYFVNVSISLICCEKNGNHILFKENNKIVFNNTSLNRNAVCIDVKHQYVFYDVEV